MGKRIGIVIFIVIGLGIFNYAGTQLSQAFSTGSLAPGAPLPMPSVVGNESNALSSVSFTLFSKNGAGWSYLTQGYGRTQFAAWYVGGFHNGVDLAAYYGAPIYAPRDGTVIAIGNQDNYCPGRGFGRFIAMSDPADSAVLWYAHLGTIDVSVGQSVSEGAKIGSVGRSGFETGTHLHFSVFEANGFSIKNKNGCGPDADGQTVNPVPYLQKFAQ